MNPLTSAIQSIGYFFTGRLHFDRTRVGAVFTAENGQRFHAFRYVRLDPRPGQPELPGAVFIPRFHVANMPVRLNILFSSAAMWFFMGLPGFRSKYWLVDDLTGDYMGYYEWDTAADAQAYSTSFAARFMTGRSTPGSVRFTMYPRDQAPPPPSKG